MKKPFRYLVSAVCLFFILSALGCGKDTTVVINDANVLVTSEAAAEYEANRNFAKSLEGTQKVVQTKLFTRYRHPSMTDEYREIVFENQATKKRQVTTLPRGNYYWGVLGEGDTVIITLRSEEPQINCTDEYHCFSPSWTEFVHYNIVR